METVRSSPVLHDQAKTGKTKYWQAHVVRDAPTKFYLQKEWWLEGGAHTKSTPERIRGKNAGRHNATTDGEQASLAFSRAVKKRRDRGFAEEGETAPVIYTKPMLAHKFKDLDEADLDALPWPVLVQPKLDGFRMLTDGDAAWTRGLKDHVRECVQHLLWDVGEYVIDGELLLPGNKPLQVSASAAKKFNRGVSETLEYHIYDIVEPDMPFSERTVLLEQLFKNGVPPNVKLVPTFLANDMADVMKCHETFKKCGYEGSMIRTRDSLYEVGFRSHGLLKLKGDSNGDFEDAEFVVVGVKEGKGSYKGKAVLILSATGTAAEIKAMSAKEIAALTLFNAAPIGTADYREMLWEHRADLIGQTWTIRYTTLSLKGKPLCAVAVAPREEDI